jgi:YbbR domain-containing protein
VSSALVRRIFLDDLGLKLLSLVFATLLWMFVVGEKRAEVSLSLPLELIQVPAEMVVVSPVPEAVRVRLNGPRTLLAAINPQQLAVSLNLEGLVPGISAFEILRSRLNLPRGVEVTYISPSVVTLEADRKARRVLPVRPRTKGVPAEGYEVAELRVEPPQVEIEGPERAVAKLREAPTEILDVGGLDGGVTRPVQLALPDPALRPLVQKALELEVVVREMRAQREFIQVPVALAEAPETGPPAWVPTPFAVDVALEGPLLTLSRLKTADVQARASLEGLGPDGGAAAVAVTVPPGVTVLSATPSEVVLRPAFTRVPPGPAEEGGPATPKPAPGGG